MIATLAFLALAQPSGATAVADPLPAVAAPATTSNTQNDYDRAAQIYDQTCNDRSYGAYDDLCDQLQKQIRQYRIQLDRQAREAASKPAKPVSSPKP
jgi:hypothetical protein